MNNFFKTIKIKHSESNIELLVSIVIIIVLLIVVTADLLVVQLQGGEVLPGLRELSLLHALPHIPEYEGPLGIHEVKLVIQPGPGLHDGSGVGEAADSPHYLPKI